MDRLVQVSTQHLQLPFKPNHRCSISFQITNLMHTMSVAVSLSIPMPTNATTTGDVEDDDHPPLFTISHPFSILAPLSTSTYSLHLSPHPLLPPLLILSAPSLLVRTSLLPTGKAHQNHLRRLFSTPNLHIFKDAVLPISLTGFHVAQSLLLGGQPPSPATISILTTAVAGCPEPKLTSLLALAVRSSHPEFVSSLIRAGGDVNFRDSQGQSLMGLALSAGNLDVVRVLIESGCEVNGSVDLFMHEAAAMNRVDLMTLLGFGWNLRDSSGRTPVHVCASHGHVDALKLCVLMGGDPDLQDCNGFSPLHCAAENGHLECVKFLLNCALYSKLAVDKHGKTPFLVAVDNGHSDLAELLHFRDVLNRAARLGDENGLRNCVNHGVEVNGKDQNGWTPLHRAAFKGKLGCVKILVSNGAEIDVVDDVGYTPLHCAVEAGHVQIAMYLIAHGARINLKSMKGVCPLNLEFHKNHPAHVPLLYTEKEQA